MGRSSCFPFSGPSNLPYPNNANLTAVEIITFLPNSLGSADVVYRFVSNRATRAAICAIINTNRSVDTEWKVEYCGRHLSKVMQQAGFHGWTMQSHTSWLSNRNEKWDECVVSMKEIKSPYRKHAESQLEDDIPFSALMEGVQKVPEGNDALDLTRMVQYSVKHPEEGWRYPGQYDKLLERIGGPMKPKAANLDPMVFERWNDMIHALSQSSAQSARRISNKTRLESETDVASMLDVVERDSDVSEAEIQEYQRGPVTYVQPPASANTLSGTGLQGGIEAKDFGAYAFGKGPRKKPPFRPLHLVSSPDVGDTSGWAENLRWAAEQTSAFGSVSWTECPEHMDLLCGIRQEQLWVSSEWIIQYLDEHAPYPAEMDIEQLGDYDYIPYAPIQLVSEEVESSETDT